MDERNRKKAELEKQKREEQVSLDLQLERLGETLFNRLENQPDGGQEDHDAAEYRRLQGKIADAETSIKIIEEQIRRFKELEETIAAREAEDKARLRELSHIYGKLGRLLFNEPSYEEFTAQYREQTEALSTKIDSLESRLNGLEQRDGGNVFSWIGKSAHSLVLRSFLTRAQDSLEQLYRSAGERYCRRDGLIAEGGGQPNTEIDVFILEIAKIKAESQTGSGELSELRAERRKISGGFSAEGGPQKQIKSLNSHIAQVKEDLKALYRRTGAAAASIDGGAAAEDADAQSRKSFAAALVRTEDSAVIDNAIRLNTLIREDEAEIARLTASLAIDDEKAKIERYQKSIEDRKRRISEAEKDIAEFENRIQDAEKHIGELQKLL